jgi:hypothetical protein
VGGRQRRLWLARALVLALLLQVLLTPAPAEALNWRLPGRGAPAQARPGTGQASPRFQEVPPPEWVQTMQGALEGRDPKVQILSPADGSLLPDAPWTLRLHVSDWPLVDAGPLGLGPHLVVQLDGQPPRPVVETEVEMAPLSPGSHVLTVYAAKPWGEAHKSPAALQQIRLHRLAPNPATLPAPGTPQLLPVSPAGPSGDPPLLLDWLLIDAPLQGLRTETLGWRLRVTLNGESVLVDRQTPLWLRGWRSGSNALLLELLDGRGEPLNPPFNSLLREVIVTPPAGPARPKSESLSPLERAVLLGEQPLSALAPATPPPSEEELASDGVPQPAVPPVLEVPVPQRPVIPQPLPQPPGASEAPPALGQGERPLSLQVEPMEPDGLAPAQSPPPQTAERPKGPIAMPVPSPAAPEPNPSSAEPSPSAPEAPAPVREPAPELALAPDAPEPPASPAQSPAPPVTLAVPESSPPSPSQALSAEAVPPPAAPSLSLSAREEVNPDGTLKRPSRPSPLERLRERLKR